MNNLKDLIQKMRDKRLAYSAIGKLLGISRQRVHQIYSNYKSPASLALIDKKRQNRINRESLRMRQINNGERANITPDILKNFTGRELTREAVRRRDKHTCQICLRQRQEGERRFDIHHLNGVCGKKSRGYDKATEIRGLITLCHKCHLGLDSVKAKMKMGWKKSIHRVKVDSE